MTERELLELKEMICDQMNAIFSELERCHSGMEEDLDECCGGSEERSFLQGLKSRLERRLEELKTALFKMERNEYAICEECEGEIPYSRMKAVPTTFYCVTCMSKIEDRTRRGEFAVSGM